MATAKLSKVGFGTAIDVTLSSTSIKADTDGFLLAFVNSNGSTIALYYIQDVTTSQTFVAASAAAGSPAYISIPWVKGHNYRVTYESNVGEVISRVYPLV